VRLTRLARTAGRDAGATIVAEPCDVPPVGRMAVLVDPVGAQFTVWEAAGREGAQLVNEPGAWAMSALRTPDPEVAREFYGRVFGWRAEAFGRPEAGVWMWRLPGYVGGEPEQPFPRDVVATMFRVDGEAAQWRPDFWVADADAAVATASELGGRVIEPPASAPGAPFRSAVLADPYGAEFSISQLVPDGAG
jgi:uncharacterized protein